MVPKTFLVVSSFYATRTSSFDATGVFNMYEINNGKCPFAKTAQYVGRHCLYSTKKQE